MADIMGSLNNIRPKTRYLTEVLLSQREPICVITHTDFWSNNLLFAREDCAVLDCQMVSNGKHNTELFMTMNGFVALQSSKLLALLLCMGSTDMAVRNPSIEQRQVDVLLDLHEDGVSTPGFVNSL
ncbi:hypothetical protein RUM44_009018 [Polyplax serrata]|uniref:CHK kinase-like domain-containing protein n=1 Tax=Polyplax serrata TaxID=468196 RepID=A0ABR1ARH6_POLSC